MRYIRPYRQARVIQLAERSYKTVAGLLNKYYRQQKVVCFHTGRCGSTVLGSMLNRHSHIYWANEIFQPYMEWSTDTKEPDFARRTIEWNMPTRVSRIYGFEVKHLPQQHFAYNAINKDLVEFMALLDELDFSKFIVLHRKNYLKRMLSWQAAWQTGVLHSSKNSVGPNRVAIDTQAFQIGVIKLPMLEMFAYIDAGYARLLEVLTARNPLLLTYEDDIMRDPRVAYRKVCEYLDIEDEAPEVELRRTNPFTPKDMLLNYDEVHALLADTKYSWMLDSE